MSILGYQTDSSSWLGVKVRRGEVCGVVIEDFNWANRILTVKMNDGTVATIRMNNFGDNPKETKEWEWWCSSHETNEWHRF